MAQFFDGKDAAIGLEKHGSRWMQNSVLS